MAELYTKRGVKDPQEAMEYVKIDGTQLHYIENQTEELCIEAVKTTPFAIAYVKDPTEKICLEAIRQDPLALDFIRNQTTRVCLEAVKMNLNALSMVNLPSEELLIEVVKLGGDALQRCISYGIEVSLPVCLEAIKHNPAAVAIWPKHIYENIKFTEAEDGRIYIDTVETDRYENI